MNTKKKNETKTERLAVPMSKKEKEAIEKRAAQLGLTTAGFIRFAIKDYLNQ